MGMGPVPAVRKLLERLGLKATLLGRAIRNIPPAAVYRISARASRQARRGGARPGAAHGRRRWLGGISG
jgi:hypothetical protein